MMLDMARFVYNSLIVILVLNTAISLYGILARPSLVKKLIALTIFSDSLNSFAILIGYRLCRGFEQPVPPIVTRIPPTQEYLSKLVATAVDPLPQALVLTAIVISLAVFAFLAALTLRIYYVSGTTDARDLALMRARAAVTEGE